MPKATVKMQSAPLAAAPAPAIRTSPAPIVTEEYEDEEDDPMVTTLSWVAAVASLVAAACAYLAFAA